jgi:[protein-PII] uridylyltransferase
MWRSSSTTSARGARATIRSWGRDRGRLAPRLGLTARETDTVVWLIRNHLLMSDVAQKRDIAEPRTVRDFASKVQSKERLDLLTVLTVCDIRGVGPGTWNNWKAMLLRAVYQATEAELLARQGEAPTAARSPREEEARRALARALPGWTPQEIEAEQGRHYGPYWLGLPTELHAVFANLLKGMQDDELRIDIKPDEGRAATRAAFAMVDHPGLFSRMTGALALVGANIRDARTYTSKDGYATATFWIQDARASPSRRRACRGCARPSCARCGRGRGARGAEGPRQAQEARGGLRGADRDPLRQRGVRHLHADRGGHARPARAPLRPHAHAGANNVYIASAVIATYGEQAVDSFYVKDMFGLKFHAEPRQKALAQKLRDAIEQGRRGRGREARGGLPHWGEAAGWGGA